MAFDYKPGEDDDLLKKYLYVAGIIVVLAILTVVVLYVGLGIDVTTLPILLRKIKLDATNVTFVFIFVVVAIALWGFFRDSAATEGVNRRQTYFIILLILAGVAIAGTIYVRRLSKPSHDVVRTEVCPRCGGTGRAKLRPEYPCGTCAGTGNITP
jgi:magnesium-transporting ATPase (P-type)